MRGLSTLLLLLAGCLLAACETTKTVTGRADDGEIFTGTANATGQWNTSGVIQLVSNRGLNCVGRFVYDGIAGPNGSATLNCSNGETAVIALTGLTSGTGEGTIGARKITVSWTG